MNRKLKILNLYAGIGGNRKLWGRVHNITAVELNPKIAEVYKDFFPEDNVIVADAHEYYRFVMCNQKQNVGEKRQICKGKQRKTHSKSSRIYRLYS